MLNCTSDLSSKLIQSTMYIGRDFVKQRVDEKIRLYVLASHMFVCASVLRYALSLAVRGLVAIHIACTGF